MWPKFLTPKKLRSDYICAVFIDSNNRERGGMVKIKDGAFMLGETRYLVDYRVATYSGAFRTPTLYYPEGNTGPVDWHGRVTITQDASEEFIRMESHVASDALRELGEDGLFSSKTLMMILIICGTVGFSWWNLNGKLDDNKSEMAAQLTRIEQQRSATGQQSPLVPFNP
jgi:hypothetical protein